MSAAKLDAVARSFREFLLAEGLPIVFRDQASGADVPVSADAAAAPDGLLPVFVVAAEAIWREVTGRGFELDIVRDADAVLQYRLRGIGDARLTTVMLAAMEATAQAMRPGARAIVVNELGAVWAASAARFERDAHVTPATGGSSVLPSAGHAP